MHLNLGSILSATHGAAPDHVAVRLGDQALTYAELDRAARGIATSLRARGIEPGSSVAIMIPNLPEFTQAYYGILYAGCTVVPLNVLLSAPEVQYHLEDSRARLLFAHPLFEAPRRRGASAAGVPVVWASVPERTRSRRSRRAADRRASPDAAHRHRGDPLHVRHHGKPKGAELTHSNLFVNCSVVLPSSCRDSDDVALATLPLFHSFGRPASRTRASLRAARSRCCRASARGGVRDHGARPRDAVRGRADDVFRAAPPRGPARDLSRCAGASRAARRCRSR
jgi:long-chain acyl-CoA synthetase